MRSRSRYEYLFSDGDLAEHLDSLRRRMLVEIEQVPENTLLNRPVDDLVADCVERHRQDGVQIRRTETSVSVDEVQIPIEDLPDAHFRFSEETTSVSGQQYNFHVPFTGDARLFKLKGSQWFSTIPHATVAATELVFSYPTIDKSADRIKQEFERQANITEQLARNSSEMVEGANKNLANAARSAIDQRRSRLLQAKNTVASLGFPMRKREQPVQTYSLPNVRKKLNTASSPSPRSSAPFRPEPTLDAAQYEDILTSIQSMALVIERSPHAFRTLGEEDIRTHFLLPLNGLYEGGATGETFNFGGKTDILIRAEDRNVFIAECKFWKGPAGFTSTIDQLLGYTSWRDTKTAILVFNRGTAMSTVLGQISGLMEAHPQFKRTIQQSGDARFRAVFRQSSDPDRELTVTVLVFDIPEA